MVTTGIIIMMIWRVMFDPSEHGVLNRLLMLFGVDTQGWLSDPNLAMLCVVLVGMWAGTGPGCIIYLAALKCVPEELYESADLDGASMVSKVRYVTIPTLLPLILINFLGAFIGAFHAMQNIFVLTGGGPANKTRVIGIDIFYQAFLYLDLGYATALAWILGSLLIGFTLYQLRILKHVDFRAAGRDV
jgi:multiple sugar transport system permease protein